MTANSNSTYQKKILQVLNNSSDLTLGFSLSAPSKIAGSKRLAFSLPAGPDYTCPGATESCKGCYAQKGRHIFPNVQKAFVRNWLTLVEFSKTSNVSGAVDALLDLIKPTSPIFRIHESGDFQNQFAIEVWTEVAKRRPTTKFWFYTRSFHLDFSKLLALPNVNGWASTDQHNQTAANNFAHKFNVKQAMGPWDHKTPRPDNAFFCPVTSGKLEVESACQKCKLCIDKNVTTKNVVFLEH